MVATLDPRELREKLDLAPVAAHLRIPLEVARERCFVAIHELCRAYDGSCQWFQLLTSDDGERSVLFIASPGRHSVELVLTVGSSQHLAG